MAKVMVASKNALPQSSMRVPAFMVDTIIADKERAVIVYQDGQYVPVNDNGKLHRLLSAAK